jgi:hypothetical protein
MGELGRCVLLCLEDRDKRGPIGLSMSFSHERERIFLSGDAVNAVGF